MRNSISSYNKSIDDLRKLVSQWYESCQNSSVYLYSFRYNRKIYACNRLKNINTLIFIQNMRPVAPHH